MSENKKIMSELYSRLIIKPADIKHLGKSFETLLSDGKIVFEATSESGTAPRHRFLKLKNGDFKSTVMVTKDKNVKWNIFDVSYSTCVPIWFVQASTFFTKAQMEDDNNGGKVLNIQDYKTKTVSCIKEESPRCCSHELKSRVKIVHLHRCY